MAAATCATVDTHLVPIVAGNITNGCRADGSTEASSPAGRP